MALKAIAHENSGSFQTQKKLYGELAEINIDGQKLFLLMPNTYMNESGRSVQATLNWFDIEKEKLLVIVDDIDLPLGRLRIRSKGSAGGHNGLKSIISHLGTQDFCRLRIGIGSPVSIPEEKQSKTISHVLGSFTNKEKEIINKTLNEAIKGIKLNQKFGFSQASNLLNSYK